MEQFSRTEQIIGADGMARLKAARVLVVGLGGVGGYVVEFLARAGVGALGICDGDTVASTNLNRQILATHQSIGLAKTDAATARIASICPETIVTAYPFFYGTESCCNLDLTAYDIVVDAIDQVTAKLLLIESAQRASVPLICCMGTGNKTDPMRFRVADIYATSICPLCKVMRHELKKRGVERLDVVYSDEPPILRATPPASLPHIPPAAATLLASYTLRVLLSSHKNANDHQ